MPGEDVTATEREPYRDLLAALGPVMDLWACDHFPRLGEEVDPECARCQTMGPLRETYAEAILTLVEQDHAAMQAEHQRGVKEDDLAVLRDLVRGSEACFYDHDSACQAHLLDPKPCPYERAKKRLSEAGMSW